MRSVTSCFNPGLLRKNLQRTWPMWFFYLLVWLLFLPIPLMTELKYGDVEQQLQILLSRIYHAAMLPGVLMGALAGLLFAMGMFGYLMHSRSTGMYHSLPISRRGLFLTNTLSGLLSVLSANALVVVFLLLVCGGYGHLGKETFAAAFTWLGAVSLEFLTFYALAVFTLMLTGQMLAVPVFYVIFNFLVPGMELLLRMYASILFYGAGSFNFYINSGWLCPIYQMSRSLGYGAMDSSHPKFFYGWGTLLIYAAAGLVLLLLAYLLYHCRPSEHASDVIAIRWLRPVFKYSASGCFALAFGLLLYALLFSDRMESYNYLLPALILCTVAAALLAYFSAEMLLKKSFRVFREGWKGALALTVVLVIFGVGLSVDITGYEGRLPEIGQVESVYVNLQYNYGRYTSGTLSQEEDIRLALALHSALLQERNQQLERARASENCYAHGKYTVEYQLKSGLRISRCYELHLQLADLSRGDSVYSRLQELYDCREMQLLQVFGNTQLIQIGDLTGGYLYCGLTNAEDSLDYDVSMSLNREQAQRLYDALRCDLQLGAFRMEWQLGGGYYQKMQPLTQSVIDVDGNRIPEGSIPRYASITLFYTRPDSPNVSREYSFELDDRAEKTWIVLNQIMQEGES